MKKLKINCNLFQSFFKPGFKGCDKKKKKNSKSIF